METIEIIKNILPGKSAYEKTLYLLYNYKDMERGIEINEEQRETLKIIDKAIELIKEDPYIEIIRLMIKGNTAEQVAEIKQLDTRSVYRQRRRLVKRLAIIIYGDVAL